MGSQAITTIDVENRMKKASKSPRRPTLRELPFEQLVAAVLELGDARREYGGKPSKERRAAAVWAYDTEMADHLFSRAVLATGGGADAAEQPP
jgi:hypothetical protein